MWSSPEAPPSRWLRDVASLIGRVNAHTTTTNLQYACYLTTVFTLKSYSKTQLAESSRSGNESFLTYFRFLSSHTTVHAVRHTAV